jgi:5-methylcytosine-specific restriction endonuclease McrA
MIIGLLGSVRHPTPSPSPSSSSSDLVGAVVHGMWAGITSAAAHAPWVVPVFVVFVVMALVNAVRTAIHSGSRDPVRRFSRPDKAVLLARAGNRCEHHGWLSGRCRTVERLEADHVHPWSRGGWTHVSNGQILCRAHNRDKRAAIPWDRQLRRLAERRGAYYPAGADPIVVRRRPRGSAPGDAQLS